MPPTACGRPGMLRPMAMLFPEAPDLPEGFRYYEDILSAEEEATLLAGVRRLAFGEVRMRGQVARRRTIHFGWTYGYETWRVEPGPAVPEFLLGLRARAAALGAAGARGLGGRRAAPYPPGAGIGWHRDAPAFGVVVGVSLLGACRFRFQQGRDTARRTRAVVLAPRSAYVLAGAARWQWQHAIPPGREERYSVTYRTLRASGGAARIWRASARGRSYTYVRGSAQDPRRYRGDSSKDQTSCRAQEPRARAPAAGARDRSPPVDHRGPTERPRARRARTVARRFAVERAG